MLSPAQACYSSGVIKTYSDYHEENGCLNQSPEDPKIIKTEVMALNIYLEPKTCVKQPPLHNGDSSTVYISNRIPSLSSESVL